jgi:hypothetical protein
MARELGTRPNAEIEAMLEEGDAWLSECSGPNPSMLDRAPHPLAGLPEVELEDDGLVDEVNVWGSPWMPFEPKP